MPMTLEEKVYEMLVRDEGVGTESTVGRCQEWAPGGLSEFEMDLLDWGCAFGIAFGLARAEEPCESNVSVGQRALEAARAAHVRYAHGISERKDGLEEARRVVAVFHEYGAPREIHDALCDLQCAVGSAPVAS